MARETGELTDRKQISLAWLFIKITFTVTTEALIKSLNVSASRRIADGFVRQAHIDS